MEKNIILVILAVLMLSFGCIGTDATNLLGGNTGTSSSGVSRTDISMAPSPDYKLAPESGSGTAATVQDAMVIKTGSATIEVPEKTLSQKYDALKALASGYGGEVYSSSYYESDSGKTQYVTVKINSKDFDAFTGRLSEIGTVKSFSSSTDDVTQQYIDVSAKLNNLEASRDRLLALYNMSANLSDIIALEKEITDVQYQIDSATQQKQYYERQTSKASVSITLSEPAPVVDKSLFEPVSQLVNMFISGLVVSLVLIVGGLGFILPIAIVGFILYKIAKFVWNRMKKK
ncbi:MAG: DUF4349 domain-containing protein [Candidatus Micrarchaeota archaeon]|nr:DUF4349 domain-containing protein [Candidatus Micrarchaeota archaeon]